MRFPSRACQARDADFALGPKSCVARASASCPGARYEARIRTSRQQRREGEGAGTGSRCGIAIGTFSWVTDLVFAESSVRACVLVRLRVGVRVCARRWEGDEEDGKTGFGHWAQKRSG